MNKICYLSEGAGIGAMLFTFIIFLAVLIGIFLLIRTLVLWYWKVDVIVKNQEQQINLLMMQNELLMQQTKVIAEFKTQSGVKQVYTARPPETNQQS
jgi:hypothetical protein